ncbi:MAG: hypothetical protein KIT11_11395 [Fimbriimonadaceae bacterium]|nr:hypothetical protein [Fimbriimonadaceae bacterium]QYK55363.1 MAG: hypothetical protein KF733_10140 [Fimbriimonadaceae bacterium]
MKRTISLLALVSIFAPGYAQNSILLTDGDATYSLNDMSGDRLSANFGTGTFFQGGVASPHQNWLWFRAGNDSREYAVSNLARLTSDRNTAEAEFTESAGGVPGGPHLKFLVQYELIETGPGRAQLTTAFLVQNLSTVSIGLSLFSYHDIDLAGTADDDSATMDPSAFSVTDPTGSTFTAQASFRNQDHQQMGGYPSLRDLLTDGSATDLDDSGSPFAPGNWTGAFQWNTTVTPGFETAFVGFTVQEISIVPEPSLLLAAGLAAASFSRRSRK